jgi:hypothetical protein
MLAGVMSIYGQRALDRGDYASAGQFGAAGAAFVILFTFTFGATWLTVPWLYPAEIFPLEVRAKGNAWGVVGWSIGNGWLTLLCPVMFKKIGPSTLFIFAACNLITLPMVWALYPESNQRTLEEMNLLFAADTPWNWDGKHSISCLQSILIRVQLSVTLPSSKSKIPNWYKLLNVVIPSSTPRQVYLKLTGAPCVECPWMSMPFGTTAPTRRLPYNTSTRVLSTSNLPPRVCVFDRTLGKRFGDPRWCLHGQFGIESICETAT